MSAKIDKILKSCKQNSQKYAFPFLLKAFFLSRTHIKDCRTRTTRCRFGSSWLDEACYNLCSITYVYCRQACR